MAALTTLSGRVMHTPREVNARVEGGRVIVRRDDRRARPNLAEVGTLLSEGPVDLIPNAGALWLDSPSHRLACPHRPRPTASTHSLTLMVRDGRLVEVRREYDRRRIASRPARAHDAKSTYAYCKHRWPRIA
jgi:hypothetical protein